MGERPETTEDGRYVVVDGRRWPARDPDLPPWREQDDAERRARWEAEVP